VADRVAELEPIVVPQVVVRIPKISRTADGEYETRASCER
jgi:hypothetical protein